MRTPETARRGVLLAVPLLVPLSMAVVFHGLRRRLSPSAAYNLGFGVYWLGWCLALPVAVLGPRGAWRVLRNGERPSGVEGVLLLLPVAGGAAAALVPHRRRVTPAVGAVMLGTAAVNAVGEELLWRGVFLAEYDDVARGSLWPLVGFSLWHLAPQLVLPSETGRWRFVLGAALVGAASSVTARRGGGLRWVLVPHLLTDACGVRAAELRLGRLAPAPRAGRGAGSTLPSR